MSEEQNRPRQDFSPGLGGEGRARETGAEPGLKREWEVVTQEVMQMIMGEMQRADEEVVLHLEERHFAAAPRVIRELGAVILEDDASLRYLGVAMPTARVITDLVEVLAFLGGSASSVPCGMAASEAAIEQLGMILGATTQRGYVVREVVGSDRVMSYFWRAIVNSRDKDRARRIFVEVLARLIPPDPLVAFQVKRYAEILLYDGDDEEDKRELGRKLMEVLLRRGENYE